MPEFCPCGRELHYTQPTTEAYVRDMVDRLGVEVVIETQQGRYFVNRHYIALHGVKAAELEALCRAGVVRREESDN